MRRKADEEEGNEEREREERDKNYY